MKCNRRACQNEGTIPHKDLQKIQPDKCFYCLECAVSINQECVKFGDQEVFDLSHLALARSQPSSAEYSTERGLGEDNWNDFGNN